MHQSNKPVCFNIVCVSYMNSVFGIVNGFIEENNPLNESNILLCLSSLSKPLAMLYVQIHALFCFSIILL